MRLINKCCLGGKWAAGGGQVGRQAGGLAGCTFLVIVLFNLIVDSIFLQSIQPTFFNLHTWFFGVSAFM